MLADVTQICRSKSPVTAELIVPRGALLLSAAGCVMVISLLIVSANLLSVGYPAGGLSLWAAE